VGVCKAIGVALVDGGTSVVPLDGEATKVKTPSEKMIVEGARTEKKVGGERKTLQRWGAKALHINSSNNQQATGN